MKPGSIVVVLPIPTYSPLEKIIKWKPVQDEKTPYMIRTISTVSGTLAVSFEEGIIGYHSNGKEIHLKAEYVREILPPGEISEEIKEVLEEENLVPLK